MLKDLLINIANLHRAQLITIGAVFGVTILYYFVGNPYYQSLLLAISMYIVLCSSWNIISGITGYVSFGHVVFWGLGAYITAVLIVKFDMPWPLALLCAGIGTGVFVAVISYPILKLSEVYFAISMLALAETMRILTAYLRGLTGGGGGIYLRPLVPVDLAYLMMALLAFFVVLMMLLLKDTRLIKSLVAIKNNELAAESLGIRTAVKKTQAFVLSAVFTAVAGGIYVLNVAFIDPRTAFDIGITLNIIMMTVFGGLGTVMGPVVGPIVFMILAETLWSRFPFVHRAVLGVVIVLLVIFLPHGILPSFASRFKRIRERREATP